MSIKLKRDAFVFVRASEPSGAPVVPGTWTTVVVGDGWYELRRPNGQVFHALRLNTLQQDTAKGVWLVVQREPEGRAGLTALAGSGSNDYADTLKALWESARAGDATARAVLRHWPDWKVTGENPGGVVRTRSIRVFDRDSGGRVPVSVLDNAGGPWNFRGWTITEVHRPALLQEIAGYDDHTPEEGTPES